MSKIIFKVSFLFCVLTGYSQAVTECAENSVSFFNDDSFTVPEFVTEIYIYVWGAAGGASCTGVTSVPGGLGAAMEGRFVVSPNDNLNILVGKMGESVEGCSTMAGAGGGGGTAVTIYNSAAGDAVLIAAGGAEEVQTHPILEDLAASHPA